MSGFRFSGEEWAYEIKCFMEEIDVSSVCHHDLFPTPTQPVGPSRIKLSPNNFLVRMNIS
jgi:hypothetical protein